MTITREQVADLREGDVVEIADDSWPGAAVCRATLGGYGCTREPDHPGKHIAGTGIGYPIPAVWS